jgi:single-stranded-DNA-specific exonuclease
VEDYTPVLNLDATVSLRDVSFKLVEQIGMLEPFGYGNPEPLFGCRELEVVSPRVVGRNHLKMTLRSRNFSVDSIGFGMGQRMEEVQDTFAVDAAFVATINEWGDRRALQLNLKAFRPST